MCGNGNRRDEKKTEKRTPDSKEKGKTLQSTGHGIAHVKFEIFGLISRVFMIDAFLNF
jgi:flagellar biosynthesis protein FlhB